MPPLVPNRLLIRITHRCPYVRALPQKKGDHLLDLPESARLQNFAELDGGTNFADVRLAWNELGLGVQVTVTGKHREPAGDAARPLGSDGATVWIDTRDARASHRASRYCHQFHLLPAGGGADRDEPAFVQTKINRAQQDAPLCGPGDVAFRHVKMKSGYRLELFLPAAVLTGYDPEQHPRLGVFYAVRDFEKGEQTPGADSDFPFGEDPSLWASLELVR